MRIGQRTISDATPTYVIAEAGSNHNRDLDMAFRLIDAGAAAGADAVKFQTFRAETLYARSSSSVEYLSRLGITKPIFDIIAECEMPVEWIPRLAERCAARGVDFMSTPFDEKACELLAPYVPAFKIASYELTHLPLIRYATSFGKPMILSTGAATMEEIDEGVACAREGAAAGLALTQCTARYPAEPDRINVLAIPALKARFGVPVGLSDHSRDPLAAPAAAVAVGGRLIEKHFTLDRTLPGPDHSFAIEPDELAAMVKIIRGVEAVLGDGIKRPLDVEAELVNFRRSIYTIRPVAAGDVITRDAVAILRRSGEPATDLRPGDVDAIVGRRAARDLPAQQLLSWQDVGPR
jgi:N-acetylneuraminate synthase